MGHSYLEGFKRNEFGTEFHFSSREKRPEFRRKRFIRTPPDRYGPSSSLSTLRVREARKNRVDRKGRKKPENGRKRLEKANFQEGWPDTVSLGGYTGGEGVGVWERVQAKPLT